MPMHSYKGHTNSDYKLDSCLSHDDAHVISGSEDGRICFWDLVEVHVRWLVKGGGVTTLYSTKCKILVHCQCIMYVTLHIKNLMLSHPVSINCVELIACLLSSQSH